jgi:protein-disulfide isomerase
MKKDKLGSKRGFILILIGAILVAGSLFYLLQQPKAVGEDTVQAPVVEEEQANTGIDIEAAMAPRYLGPESALVRIEEFASLSCGHCAQFHNTTLKQLEEKYISTGQVRVQFTDFPLNRPALDASMTARCLPADQYVPFVTQLFAEQESWAFDQGYLSKLRTYAESYGMDGEAFKACLASDALRQAIIDRMQAAQKQWEVNSTPTFVINNDKDTIVVGAQPLEAFEPGLQKALTAQ